MKNINFIKTGMENFCCYIEPMEYEFKNDKIILITGPNGVGKSSILDSIQFCLFGETGKGAKSSDVVNNVTGKNCHTYVEFTSQTSDDIINKYRVDRYVKHSKLGDTVLLFKDNMSKPYKKGHKEVLPEIEKILIPQKLFTNTLLFGQKVKDFFTDLPDSERKDIFRKVLQLDDYVLYQDEANKRIKQSNNDLLELDKKVELNTKFLADTDNRISITENDKRNFTLTKNQEILILTQKNDQLKYDLSKIIEKQKSLEGFNDLTLDETNRTISTIQNEIQNITTETNNLIEGLIGTKNLKESEFNSKSQNLFSENLLEKTNLISNLESEYQKYKTENDKIIVSLNNANSDYLKKIDFNEKEIFKNNSEITKLKNHLSKTDATCPTCGKPLTEDSIKKQLTDNLNNLIDSNRKMETENKELLLYERKNSEDINEQKRIVKDKETTIKNKLSEIENNFKDKNNEVNLKLAEAKEKLNNLFNDKKSEIKNNEYNKKQSLDKELDKLLVEKRRIFSILEEKKLLETQFYTIKTNIDVTLKLLENKERETFNKSILENYLSEKERLKQELKLLFEEKGLIENKIEILEFWKMGFSSTGIPSLLIDESIPFLNISVSNYLDLVGGRYKASFDTISTTKSGEYRDKINVNVLDTQTKANNRKQLSGGQTRIIDIAILLSLCDLQNNIQDMKTNILLLDEIFDSLDDQNIGYVSSLLRTLIKDKSINIISHRHIDSIESDEVIRLF